MIPYTEYRELWTLRRVLIGTVIAVASALLWIIQLWPVIALLISLTGCVAYHDKPPVLINEYDPALSSHRDALKWDD
jgi:hypothetical protein